MEALSAHQQQAHTIQSQATYSIISTKRCIVIFLVIGMQQK